MSFYISYFVITSLVGGDNIIYYFLNWNGCWHVHAEVPCILDGACDTSRWLKICFYHLIFFLSCHFSRWVTHVIYKWLVFHGWPFLFFLSFFSLVPKKLNLTLIVVVVLESIILVLILVSFFFVEVYLFSI